MLVNFKRSFFSAGGVLYEQGTREYNEGGPETLPSSALIVSENGTLPVRSNSPKPGFGAKTLEEQALDLIPGASPTGQIPSGGVNPHAVSPLTIQERLDAAQERQRAEEATEAERVEKAKAEDEALKVEVEAGVANAEKVVEQIGKTTDPLSKLDELSPPKKK